MPFSEFIFKGNGHFLNAADNKRVAIGELEFNAATVRGNNRFPVQQHIAGLEFAQFTIGIAGISLADHCYYIRYRYICHDCFLLTPSGAAKM